LRILLFAVTLPFMPRARTKKIFPLALSPAMTADALGIRADEIAAAILSGDLPIYRVGTRRRIFVRDALRWARRNWTRS
jgi:hypothetical protein